MDAIMEMNFNEIMPIYKDKKLQSATEKILKMGHTMRNCAYETAHIIAEVDGTKCYKKDGYKSVHEWTEKTFGFKKSVSYTLLKIGKEFSAPVLNEKTGRIESWRSNLTEVDKEDFTTTQVEKMLPAGREKAAKLIEQGDINPQMSCKEISKKIKSALGKDSNKKEVQEVQEVQIEDVPINKDANTDIDFREMAEFNLSTAIEDMYNALGKDAVMIDVWDSSGNKYVMPNFLLQKFLDDIKVKE